jgi:hypothetical protein
MSDDLEHTVIPFRCPACGHQGKAARRFGGKPFRCPACETALTVPPPLDQPGATDKLAPLPRPDNPSPPSSPAG